MIIPAQSKKKYSPEEYLGLEREADYKSEYLQGEIVTMAVVGRNHNRIKSNLSGEIGNFLKGTSCRSYSSDFRIHILANTSYTYPDVLVVCGKEEFLDENTDTLLNPKIIIEVLSKSTGSYDRGEKFQLYRSIPSLEEYVLIDSQRIAAEVFRKNEKGFWSLMSESYTLEGSIELPSIGFTLPMRDIYDQIEDLGS